MTPSSPSSPGKPYTRPSWALKTLGVQAQALSPTGQAPLDSQPWQSPKTWFCPTARSTFRALQMVLPDRWDWKQSTEVVPFKEISSLSSHHIWALFRSLHPSSWGTGPLKLGVLLTKCPCRSCESGSPFQLPVTPVVVYLSQTQNRRRNFPPSLKSAFCSYCLPQKSIFFTLTGWNVYSSA